jgi:hypothetical protein
MDLFKINEEIKVTQEHDVSLSEALIIGIKDRLK